MYPSVGDNLMFAVFPVVIPIIVVLGFVTVIGLFIAAAVRGAIQWNKNNNSPILTVTAKVVAKRASVSHHHHNHGDNMSMSHSYSSTSYYATFEVESGDRMEFTMSGGEYGMLVEGDFGHITFQGTRYKGFERERNRT